MTLNLINIIALSGFSFVLHFLSLGIIRLGVFGVNLNLCLDNILKRYINYIPIFSFIVFKLLEIYLSYNVIFLDSKDVIVFTHLDLTNMILSGNVLNLIYEQLGSAAVYAVSARIAAGLLIKHPVGVFPKIGVLGGISAGYRVLYKMVMINASYNLFDVAANVPTTYLHIRLQTSPNHTFDGNAVNSLINSFGLSNMSPANLFGFEESSNVSKVILNSQNSYSHSSIISALNEQTPN